LSANSSLEVACSSIDLVRLLSVAGKAQPLPLCSFIHSTHLSNAAMLHARTFAQCCGPLIMPALWSEQNCFCTFLWLQFSVEQPCSKHRSQVTNNFLPQVWILWPCGPFRCYKHCWHFRSGSCLFSSCGHKLKCPSCLSLVHVWLLICHSTDVPAMAHYTCDLASATL
jgi:hypothetical protein